MRKQVSKLALWGKSRAVIVPRHMCRELHWNVGDLMHLEIQGNVIVMQRLELPVSPRVVPVQNREAVAE